MLTMTDAEWTWLCSRCDCATHRHDHEWQKLLRQARAEILALHELEAELSAYRARDEKQTATYDAVVALIENPPTPTPALVQLMREAREQNPDGFKSHEELLAELNKRRRQPVIATCRDCSYVNEDEQKPTCGHPSSPGAGDEIVNIYESPLLDCPLRGAT